MCGFCTVWMCEAYVTRVGIWWVLLWCGCTELVYNCTVWFCIFFKMCGGVYVWVLYCMDV